MRVILAALSLLLISLSSANAYWTTDYGRTPARHVVYRHRHHAERLGGLTQADARPADCYGIPWCGCYLRHLLGIADKSFNLAARWFKWGHPSGPCVGCVAVSYHHVAYIAAGHPGDWIVKQGNPLRYGHDTLRWAVAYRAP